MEDNELRLNEQQVDDAIWQAIYGWNHGATIPKIVTAIRATFKQAGYRKLPTGEPELLSIGEAGKLLATKRTREACLSCVVRVAQAQLDSDRKYMTVDYTKFVPRDPLQVAMSRSQFLKLPVELRQKVLEKAEEQMDDEYIKELHEWCK